MRRLEALDGLRGYFLVFMMLNHLFFRDGYLLVKFNHQELGYVQDAQGFVFLSGLLIGMVYTGRMRREGFWPGARRIWHRAFQIYLYALGCLLATMAFAALHPDPQAIWGPWLWQLADNKPSFAVAAFLLLYQPSFMDILPQYIVYLIFAPPLVWLCIKGRWLPIAVGSGLLWLAVQLGAHLPFAAAVDQTMRAIDPELPFRAYFNVLAWQTVFMSGLVLGSMTVTGRIDWQTVFDPRRTAILWTAVAVVFFFMAWRLALSFDLLPEATVQRFRAAEVRDTFALLYAVNFAAVAYLAGWLMIAGVRSEAVWPRRIGEALHAVFSIPFLRLIGRHSLQVYAWHVVVIYALKAFEFHAGPFPDWEESLVAAVAVASLAIPALVREAHLARRKAAQAAAAKTAGVGDGGRFPGGVPSRPLTTTS